MLGYLRTAVVNGARSVRRTRGDETDQVNLATGAFARFRQPPEFLSGYRISSIAW